MTGSTTLSDWASVAAEIDSCRQQLRACEKAFSDVAYNEENAEYEEIFDGEKRHLGFKIRQVNFRILILIEKLGLNNFRETYIRGLAGYPFNKVDHTHFDPEILYSEALSYIDESFEALSVMMAGQNNIGNYAVSLLERILRNAPFILADRGIVPNNEAEVRRPIYDLLKNVFPDCRNDEPVSHIFKTYKADFGIRSLGALVEVKYALDEKELKSELDGVYADIKGYTGGTDWNKFFALFYTAAPIASQERLEEEFKLSRVDISWTPIIVHGAGTRTKRSKK